jgi:hypothetical protein
MIEYKWKDNKKEIVAGSKWIRNGYFHLLAGMATKNQPCREGRFRYWLTKDLSIRGLKSDQLPVFGSLPPKMIGVDG